MTNRRKYGLLIFTMSLILISLACGFGGSSESTQKMPTAVSNATQVESADLPVQPTDTIESTETINEETIQEPTTDSSDGQAETPPPEEELVTPPLENAVYVKSVHGYRDQLGYLHIVGLVTNNTDSMVENVEVEVNIIDNDGTTLQSEITTTSLTTLAPGETSPFAYWVSGEIPNAESYVAAIVGESTAETERTSIKVDGDMLTIDENGDIHITGKLVNNTINPVLINSLAAAVFSNTGGLVTAEAHSVIVRHLDPGEDGPFRVTMTGPSGDLTNIEEYEIYIDAEETEPIEVFDFEISESHYYYVDSYDGFHLVGEVTNNNDEFFTISLVAGIYDADGNVVDAATTDIPTFSIAPGETLPYDFKYWGPLNYQPGAIDKATNYYVQWDPYWTWSSSSEYVEMSTRNDSSEVDTLEISFMGDVVNNSGEEVESATVIVSLYDNQSGELIATGYGGIYETIAPNASAVYQVWIETPADFDINSVETEIIAVGDIP